MPGRRPDRHELAIAAVFALWLLAPVVILFVHTGGGLRLGSQGRYFLGPLQPDVPDQLQYMAWTRDAGNHVLFSNLFDLRPDPRLFLHPVFALSGLAHRLGASLQVAFLAWQPLWALALVAGFAVYVRELVDGAAARAAALVLALFMFTPATGLIDWLDLGDANLRFGSQVMGLETFAGGYVAGAGVLSAALMGPFLLGVARIADGAGEGTGRAWRVPAATAAAGAVVSWMHPWQGLTALVIVAAAVAWGRAWRAARSLAAPLAATLTPLLYYAVLSHTDSAWRDVARPNHYAHFGLWFAVTMVPLGLLAAPGLPGRGLDTRQRILRLWPAAAFAVYIGLHSSWIYHAFVGTSLPLAVLAVNGWRRVGVRRSLALLAIGLMTLPGCFWYLQRLERERSAHFVTAGEAAALTYLRNAPGRGGVLAPEPLGTAVPVFGGRATWVGHPTWTPSWSLRSAEADALFGGRLQASGARALVIATGARFLLADCRSHGDLRALLGGLVGPARRFGCAAVYELARR